MPVNKRPEHLVTMTDAGTPVPELASPEISTLPRQTTLAVPSRIFVCKKRIRADCAADWLLQKHVRCQYQENHRGPKQQRPKKNQPRMKRAFSWFDSISPNADE